ncbi:NAD-dependent epimerase/dehydratase family protein [Pseudonocardia pini]|uniref:NAD-dependent epimerase/dehydratase family protein n=1 Tax=Pseudonocardia pini TaxID=2758030 RepID=UPI0015F0BA1B|nr:NAD-dependent epimerase/dehydratase family protein [Pseudonocardia pini]
MNLFLIGGSGYIGRSVAERLQADGHRLTGLARSPRAEADLRAAGVTPVPGALGDAEVLAEAAKAADGVVQISTGGFLTQALETIDATVRTTDVLLDALDGTDKPYVLTSGTGLWMDTGIAIPSRTVTEDDPISPAYFYAHLGTIHRRVTEQDRVRAIVIAPGQVYGRDGGYIGPIARTFGGVRRHGVVHAVSTSDNAFTYVHVDDLADLYALVLRDPATQGLFLGAVDTVPTLEMAEAVSVAAGLGGAVECVDYPRMRALNGRAGELDFWANVRASGAKAMRELGWEPSRPGVVEEITSLPRPLELEAYYPGPRRKAAASAVRA